MIVSWWMLLCTQYRQPRSSSVNGNLEAQRCTFLVSVCGNSGGREVCVYPEREEQRRD